MSVWGEVQPGMGMCSCGWMAWETQGMDKGMGEWTKAQVMVQVCTAMAKGARAHEM